MERSGTMLTAMEPFARALWDYYHGREASLLIRRDDDHITHVSLDDYLVGYEEWPEAQKELTDMAEGMVLDAGCGAGRHALHLQAKGITVVGLDISPLLAKLCRERGLTHAVVGAMPSLPFRDGAFKTVMCMGNTLGICGGPERTVMLLREFRRVARGDGILLADLIDPAKTEKEAHLRYHELNRRRGRPIGLVTIRFEYGGHIGDWFELYLIQPEELREACPKAGWSVVALLHEGEPHYGLIASAM